MEAAGLEPRIGAFLWYHAVVVGPGPHTQAS